MPSFIFSMFGWVFVDSGNFFILALNFKSFFSFLGCSICVCKFSYFKLHRLILVVIASSEHVLLISLANVSFSSFFSSVIFICSFSVLLLKFFCALDCWVTVSLLKSSCFGETFFILAGIAYNPLPVFSVAVLLSSFELQVSFENSWFFACCSLCLLLSEVWFFPRVLSS